MGNSEAVDAVGIVEQWLRCGNSQEQWMCGTISGAVDAPPCGYSGAGDVWVIVEQWIWGVPREQWIDCG